ncbi:hypothetical protein [Chromohalobacter israelensis]|uniref:hypothetical protein n=1 Tax=Chromohalobacter israelensis TaxID=141390 RepID=UPI000FFF0F72|nr:hypothetical protein [Chromohalobacter salexigens]RXE49218.1 hypothetical protein B4O83_15075 [Chromohalobacter salexigens]
MQNRLTKTGVGSVLVALATFVGASAQAASYSLDMQYAEDASSQQKQQAKAALDRFVSACPALAQANQSPDAELIPAMPYREDTYGWPWEVHVRIAIDEASDVAPGHTLDYYIWGDGWVTQKGIAAEFCGEDGNTGADTYVAFDEL